MAVIHGQSSKALKHMRKPSATLAVYWCYVSRMNGEGVSWPSLRGLVKDTGWSINECTEAREKLILHKALELVEDYVRPQWRNLPEKTLALRRNLDKAQYYRPTGYFEVSNIAYPILYFPSQDANDIDDDATMYHSVRHRTAIDIAQDDTELGTSSTELGNKSFPKGKGSTRPAKLFNPYKDVLITAYGWNWTTATKTEKGQIQAAAAQLYDISFPLVDIPPFIKYCRERYDNITPPGCCGHVAEWRELNATKRLVDRTANGHGTDNLVSQWDTDNEPIQQGVDYT